jgi:hypothetical protein
MPFPSLWTGGELFGTPTLPVTASLIPVLEGSFTFVPLLVAIYYAGELVWRERDRKMHEIVDATPLPNWAYVVPKTAAVALVLLSILPVSGLAAMLVQLVKGHTNLEIGKYLAWYVLPNGVDFLLLAVLAVFVQAVSPNKYVGWGIMVLYVVLQIIAGNVGLEHNLYVYGGVPRVQYSDMNGAGSFWIGAWAFRPTGRGRADPASRCAPALAPRDGDPAQAPPRPRSCASAGHARRARRREPPGRARAWRLDFLQHQCPQRISHQR